MGDIRGFLKVKRQAAEYRPVCERVKDYREAAVLRNTEDSQQQASRCMDCGTPFCHWACPIGNYIPEWNDLSFRGRWQEAFQLLSATNNFPEITGRLCPAQCEFACTLGINDDPVTVMENELSIIEYAFKHGFIKPNLPKRRTGKRIAVIGSGPAGLSCANQLNKAGHSMVVLEKDDKVGGILRFGIPDFKLEKWVLDRRTKILEKEGIEFITSINVGQDYATTKLQKEFDAICLAIGCRLPRDLKIKGRSLKGIHFAMDYLTCANKRVTGERTAADKFIDAKDKRVVVIGGGDTGADCVGIAHRQGASCVIQIELLPQPPDCRSPDYPWPKYPLILKTSTSHEEGAERKWSILTKKFIGENGWIKKLYCVKVEFEKDSGGCQVMKEAAGSEFEIEADLVILALGFLHTEHSGLVKDLGLELDSKGNVKTDENYMTKVPGVFSAGDMHRGQSLVVWAISEGRKAAHYIDKYLMGETYLPR
ncbi:MAG: glutamate synthase [Candidatus Omnitrophica bacterium CG23_combo_of_CG06-09_8_20_14_all_40_11]|nr:MAG: glutamate synthase [Candidatus Omnitrophica bacterium CG23_combo_of_CG06-09_8_20_14_all_40_11]